MLINGIVLGVKDVVDGSAKAAVDELGRVLQQIKEVGLQLNLPGADKIGWALIQSSMSDGASTQKLFNKLVQEKIEAEQKDSVHATIPTNDTKNLLQLFCGMHLGVNLRAAQVNDLLSGRSVGVDSVVHATCKLLGHLGTNPEYSTSFPRVCTVSNGRSRCYR